MTDLSAHLRAALWWLLPLAALLVVIGWETGWGSAFDRRPPPAEPIAPKPVVASLLPEYAIVGGAAGHSEMVERTLFNPTRRPAPVAPAAGTARLQRGQFALTGTLVIDGKSTAYLREVSGNKARHVMAGEKLNGMLVAEVKPDQVRLTLGDESEVLTLKVATNPRPTAPPAAPVAVATPNAPGAPVAQPPIAQTAVPPGAPEIAQTLAERRRAARVAAGSEAAAQPAAGAAAATPSAGTPPTGADPRWGQMDQRLRNRGTPAAGGTTR